MAARKTKDTGKTRADRKAEAGRQKSKTREWLEALVFAVVVMLVVRTLIFDLFRIPTPSMEKNLMVGDYLFVSKIHYGTRTPHTLGIPFTQISVPGVNLPHTRLPGFSEVKRNDAIVFNWPGDVEHPIDRRTHYVKRVIGLPGETIEVVDKVVHIDGEPQSLRDGMQQWWNVYKTNARSRLSPPSLAELGVTGQRGTLDPAIVQINGTEHAAREIEKWSWVERVEPAIEPADPSYRQALYPQGTSWSPDNYGPVTIPGEGLTFDISPENWSIYEPVIRKYEGHSTGQTEDGSPLVDGQPVTSFTFTQDYFYVLGDNRNNSEDSRFWGFVPMSHVVGKAVVVYFSWDKEKNVPRFKRIFSRIK